MKLKNKWIFLLVCLATLLTLYAAHPVYLRALGHLMVVSDPLEKSDAIVVLDGDYPQDERLLHAVQLWNEGYASKVILSAKLADWQTYEDYPSWRHAVKLRIFPEDALLVAAHNMDLKKSSS